MKPLFQDDYLLAVNKPSGMLVHRGWAKADVVLVDLVREITGMKKTHPLHRLDRGAGGVIVFALDTDIARKLSQLQREKKIQKHYLALVRGIIPESGLVNHPLKNKKDGPDGDAKTAFRRIETVEILPRTLSLVEAVLNTGRLHQVRRHLKHISHPIIGDAKYGKGDLNRAYRDNFALERMALHAFSIKFNHPVTGQNIEIHAPLPDDLTGPLIRMGFSEKSLNICVRPVEDWAACLLTGDP